MPVGQWTHKFTWLLDDVEVRGLVTWVDAGDTKIDIQLDPNYVHLANHVNTAAWKDHVARWHDVIHCEAYHQIPNTVNRQLPFTGPKHNGQVQQVLDLKNGGLRDVQVGDHVRVVGRWLIENGHPEATFNQGPLKVLKIGATWVELHPYHWENVQTVEPAPVSGTESEVLSLAAPVYSHAYVGEGKWAGNYLNGLASWPWEEPKQQRLFIEDDRSNFRNTMRAKMRITAPPLPPGLHGDRTLIKYHEAVLQDGTGLPLDQIRTITVDDYGIEIAASVTAPPLSARGGTDTDAGTASLRDRLASVNDPANGLSVFQARYSVSWLPRLFARPGEHDVGSGDVGSPLNAPNLRIKIHNVGPDDLQLLGWDFDGTANAAVELHLPANGLTVPAHGIGDLDGTVVPDNPGPYIQWIVLKTDDPIAPEIPVRVSGFGIAQIRPGRIRPRGFMDPRRFSGPLMI
jgi:hypothetical protein